MRYEDKSCKSRSIGTSLGTEAAGEGLKSLMGLVTQHAGSFCVR